MAITEEKIPTVDQLQQVVTSIEKRFIRAEEWPEKDPGSGLGDRTTIRNQFHPKNRETPATQDSFKSLNSKGPDKPQGQTTSSGKNSRYPPKPAAAKGGNPPTGTLGQSSNSATSKPASPLRLKINRVGKRPMERVLQHQPQQRSISAMSAALRMSMSGTVPISVGGKGVKRL